MDMFFVERLTKWRTRSISPTSGSGGGASATLSAGKSLGVGTSHSGTRWQRRPGLLSSNSRAVDWFFSMGGRVRFSRGSQNRAVLRTAAKRGVFADSAPLGDGLSGAQVRPRGGGQAVDLGARPLLGDGDGEAVVQAGVPAA